jgi:hypothetical protein
VRIFEILAKWRSPERVGPGAEGEQQPGGKTARTSEKQLPAGHFGDISMVLVAVRPNRSGRYMSSTFAWGNT